MEEQSRSIVEEQKRNESDQVVSSEPRPRPMRYRRMRHPLSSAIWGVGLLLSLSILLGSALIALPNIGAVLLNGQVAKSGTPSGGSDTSGSANNAAAPTPTADPGPQKATASIGNSPILGNKAKAKVAIVGWTDFECPYCKQFHQATFDSIVKQYVDTGKAIFVLRNFPLSFHGEAAQKEANVALCVRDAGGDKAYFQFVGDIFSNTGTNGAGMLDDKLFSLASKYGVKKAAFDACIAGKYKSVVEADTNDGSKAGVTGTPGFVIGTLGKDGTVDGELIAGAYPITEFQKVIDSYLQ